MDWTVNDELYNRFLKWKLKCENILECELVMLTESRKCKKLLAWSGDFSLDQYISWNLSSEESTLEIIWKKYEDFCKPQANGMGQDLICWQAFGKLIEVLMSGTMLYKCKLH